MDILKLKINGSLFRRDLYVKEHISRETEREILLPKMTLFISDVGCLYSQAKILNESVELSEKLYEDNIKKFLKQIFQSLDMKLEITRIVLDRSVRTAHVVFSSEKYLKAALKHIRTMEKPVEVYLNGQNGASVEEPQEIGSEKKLSHSEMKKEVNEFMLEFERKEKEERERSLNDVGKTDADGFIVTTSRAAELDDDVEDNLRVRVTKRNIERDEFNEFGIKKSKIQKDFYSFQKRQTKIDKLSELRRRFEEDKEKLVELKEKHGLNPLDQD